MTGHNATGRVRRPVAPCRRSLTTRQSNCCRLHTGRGGGTTTGFPYRYVYRSCCCMPIPATADSGRTSDLGRPTQGTIGSSYAVSVPVTTGLSNTTLSPFPSAHPRPVSNNGPGHATYGHATAIGPSVFARSDTPDDSRPRQPATTVQDAVTDKEET